MNSRNIDTDKIESTAQEMINVLVGYKGTLRGSEALGHACDVMTILTRVILVAITLEAQILSKVSTTDVKEGQKNLLAALKLALDQRIELEPDETYSVVVKKISDTLN